MVSKLHIPYCEFYITNVCNLACPGCNRFNNYHFTGYQKWQDHADDYRRWSQEITIGSIAILGGEPLLNPTFMDWAHGLRALWPDTTVRIITNAFQLKRVHGLYDALAADPKLKLWVGIHNKQHKKKIIDLVHEFLSGPCDSVFDPTDPYNQNLVLTDANGVSVTIEYNWWFHQGSLIHDTETGALTLHSSDPKKAHDICHMKTCHHFVRGKLYKCGVVAVLPEFDQQHSLSLSPDDRELVTSYRALSVTDSEEIKKDFVAKLQDPIPQCRFCPEVYHGDQIWAQEKKHIRIERI